MHGFCNNVCNGLLLVLGTTASIRVVNNGINTEWHIKRNHTIAWLAGGLRPTYWFDRGYPRNREMGIGNSWTDSAHTKKAYTAKMEHKQQQQDELQYKQTMQSNNQLSLLLLFNHALTKRHVERERVPQYIHTFTYNHGSPDLKNQRQPVKETAAHYCNTTLGKNARALQLVLPKQRRNNNSVREKCNSTNLRLFGFSLLLSSLASLLFVMVMRNWWICLWGILFCLFFFFV